MVSNAYLPWLSCIELIDGDRLAELLVKYRVGTQEELTVTLYRLDEDCFDTL